MRLLTYLDIEACIGRAEVFTDPKLRAMSRSGHLNARRRIIIGDVSERNR